MIDYANTWAAKNQITPDVEGAFGLPIGGDTLVRSACPLVVESPQFVDGMQDKSARNRHEVGNATFGTTPGTSAWRPPDW